MDTSNRTRTDISWINCYGHTPTSCTRNRFIPSAIYAMAAIYLYSRESISNGDARLYDLGSFHRMDYDRFSRLSVLWNFP